MHARRLPCVLAVNARPPLLAPPDTAVSTSDAEKEWNMERSRLVVYRSIVCSVERSATRFTGYLKLPGMSAVSIRALVCDTLKVELVPDAVIAVIMRKSQGNPLYATELAQHFQDLGMLRVDDAGTNNNDAASGGGGDGGDNGRVCVVVDNPNLERGIYSLVNDDDTTGNDDEGGGGDSAAMQLTRVLETQVSSANSSFIHSFIHSFVH
jgi:hypothetical protein